MSVGLLSKFATQALNFALEGAQQFFFPVRGHSCEEYVNLYWNFAKGTTTKAQGTTAIAVGAVGYFEACMYVYYILSIKI